MNVLDRLLSDEVRARLDDLSSALAGGYASAAPFPHAVIDDFLPADLLEHALAAFPRPGEIVWQRFEGEHEKKFGYFNAEDMPSSLRDVLYFLNSPVILGFLERLTGIQGLIPDVYYYGGGLHQTERGGFLDLHADFNRPVHLRLNRRLNLLLYLNRGWKEEYAGHLELWNREMTHCVQRILPVFNRCVIFTTDDHSFHGNPTPLTCPETQTRKSIVAYYYTAFPPNAEEQPWHSSLFQTPQQENAPEDASSSAATARTIKNALRRVIPPIAIDVYHRLRGNRGG